MTMFYIWLLWLMVMPQDSYGIDCSQFTGWVSVHQTGNKVQRPEGSATLTCAFDISAGIFKNLTWHIETTEGKDLIAYRYWLSTRTYEVDANYADVVSVPEEPVIQHNEGTSVISVEENVEEPYMFKCVIYLTNGEHCSGQISTQFEDPPVSILLDGVEVYQSNQESDNCSLDEVPDWYNEYKSIECKTEYTSGEASMEVSYLRLYKDQLIQSNDDVHCKRDVQDHLYWMCEATLAAQLLRSKTKMSCLVNDSRGVTLVQCNLPSSFRMEGQRGLPGAPGQRGLSGLPGASAQPGLPGISGAPGRPGMSGAPGERGIPGAPGALGNPGVKGDRGFPGTSGQVGLPGLRGQSGAKGARGPAGPSGQIGSPGPVGAVEKLDADCVDKYMNCSGLTHVCQSDDIMYGTVIWKDWMSDNCKHTCALCASGAVGPYMLKNENMTRNQVIFFDESKLPLIENCANVLEVETDITFRIQRDDSSSLSIVKYWREDTGEVEVFRFNVGYADHTNVVCDGHTLTCNGNRRGQHQCNNLTEGVSVPAIVLSADFYPRSGASHNNQWTRNKYSLRGSYYRATCPEPECYVTSTNDNMMECANGQFGRKWNGCVGQDSVRVRCPHNYLPCNDLARNGIEFGCWFDCTNHGGVKGCTIEDVVYEESFSKGLDYSGTTHCTKWNLFRTGLSPMKSTKVTMYGNLTSHVITCDITSVVRSLAFAMATDQNYYGVCEGRAWSFCASKNELWLDAPSQCDRNNCPSPGYILRPCFGGAFWGGVGTATCNDGTRSQVMGVKFEY